MQDLIDAMLIFQKYIEKGSYSDKFPTNCCVQEMLLVNVITEKDIISEEDQGKLSELGFDWYDEYECYGSSLFGSN